MELIQQLFQTLIHLSPSSINQFIALVGPGLFYAVLFLIVFAETGLVVTPLLPGDSLLFAMGALAANDGSPLSLPLLMALLIGAAVLGDVPLLEPRPTRHVSVPPRPLRSDP